MGVSADRVWPSRLLIVICSDSSADNERPALWIWPRPGNAIVRNWARLDKITERGDLNQHAENVLCGAMGWRLELRP